MKYGSSVSRSSRLLAALAILVLVIASGPARGQTAGPRDLTPLKFRQSSIPGESDDSA
jgi:hypothetical protein